MDACIYLIKQQWKNDFRKKKQGLPFWLGMAVVVLYLLYCIYQTVRRFGKTASVSGAMPKFTALSMFLFLVLTFVAFLLGITKGSTWFSASDINFMFISPVSPGKALIYGILRRLIVSVPITLFLITQLPTIHFYLQVSAKDLFLFVLTWLILLASLTILSISVYAVTAMHRAVRRLLLITVFLCGGVLIGGATFSLWRSGTNFGGVVEFLNEPRLQLIPLGGWATGFLVNTMNGEYGKALFYLALLALLSLVAFVLIILSRSDYYEEVVTSIGHGYGILHDEKDPQEGAVRVRRRKTHLLGHSSGEVVLMMRRITEQSKGSFLLLDRYSLIIIGTSVFLGAVMHVFMRKGMYPLVMEVMTLAVLTYLSILVMPIGRFIDELKKPFIFLMPGRPVKKLLFASAAPMLKCLIESAISLTIVSFFAQLPAAFVFYGAMFQSSAIVLYCAAYVASVRTMGILHSEFSRRVLALAVVSAIFMFEMSLGINIGHELYIAATTIFLVDFMILAIVNFIAALVFFFSARSILEYRD